MANLTPRETDWMAMDDRFFPRFSHFMRNNDFNVDIKENKQEYQVKADLPGFNKEDLQVTYHDGLLKISAKRDQSSEEKDEDGHYIRQERSTSSFVRRFMLKGVEEENIKASFENGVLHIILPKSSSEMENHKNIPIE